MNRNYGRGVSEWSVQIIPAKLAVVLAIGALVATNFLLLKQLPRACARATPYSGLAATGLGAALVGFTSVTLTWVVCCAAPSWAVGLAMLGVSVATAFGVQPYGPVITLAGFVALFGATYLLARDVPRTFGPGVADAASRTNQCLVKPNRVRTSDAEEHRKARRNRGRRSRRSKEFARTRAISSSTRSASRSEGARSEAPRWNGLRWRSSPVNSSACSVHRVAASRRCSIASPAMFRPPRAASRSTALRSTAPVRIAAWYFSSIRCFPG